MTATTALAVAVGFVVGAVALYVAVAWGAGKGGDWDSANYIDGARHLARGQGFTTTRLHRAFGTEPAAITLWAPGFPLLTVPFIWLGGSVVGAAGAVIGASYVAMVVLVFAMGVLVGGRRGLPLAALVSLAFAFEPGVLGAVDALMSDMPFAATSTLATFLALRLTRHRRPGRLPQLVTGAVIGAAFVIRYAGLWLVAGLLLGVWVARGRPKDLLARGRAHLPLVAGALLTASPLAVRNWLTNGSPLGRRAVQESRMWVHAKLSVRTVFQFITDAFAAVRAERTVLTMKVTLAAALIGLVIVAARTRLLRSRHFRVLFLTAGTYVGMMIVSASLHDFNSLSNPRFFLPAWPLLGVILVHVASRPRRPLQRLLTLPVWIATLGSLFLFLQAFRAGVPHRPGPHDLLGPRWVHAASLLPPGSECEYLANEVRPMLIHRPLPLTALLPDNVADVDEALRTHPRLCVIYVNDRLTGSAERARSGQVALIKKLKAAGRLEELRHDSAVRILRVLH